MARDVYVNFVCLDAHQVDDAYRGAIGDFETAPDPRYPVVLLKIPGSPMALNIAVDAVRRVCDEKNAGINCLMFAGHGSPRGQWVGYYRSEPGLSTIVAAPHMRCHVLRAMTPLKGLFRDHRESEYSDGKVVLKGCHILGGVPTPEEYRNGGYAWGASNMIPLRLIKRIAETLQVRVLAGHSQQLFGGGASYHMAGEFGVSHHRYASRWNLEGMHFWLKDDGKTYDFDAPSTSLVFEQNPAISMKSWPEHSGKKHI